MSSILTNTSAMVALQTLKGINSGLEKTQAEISTGKSVGNAKDNAAVFAISKVMESDVRGFKGISDSLSLGESTVAVARQAAETVTDLLTDMKGKIVAAQEENVDRAKIQTDIVALREQIASVVGAAQFNGLNLVDGSSTDPVNVLSSLDRDSSGNVTAGQIQVNRQNLSVTTPVTAQAFGTTDLADTAAASALIVEIVVAETVALVLAAPAAATSVKTHALLVTFASPQDQSDKHVGRMTCTIHRKGAVWESLYQLFRGARMFLQARLQVGLRLILWPCRTIGKAFDCDIPALPIEGKP